MKEKASNQVLFEQVSVRARSRRVGRGEDLVPSPSLEGSSMAGAETSARPSTSMMAPWLVEMR